MFRPCNTVMHVRNNFLSSAPPANRAEKNICDGFSSSAEAMANGRYRLHATDETETMTDAMGHETLLTARSAAERQFYLMASACERCAAGPLEVVSQEQSSDGRADIWIVQCRSCRSGRRLLFDRQALQIPDSPTAAIPRVSMSNEPSTLLDVGQWLSLFYAIVAHAARESSRRNSQRLGYEATLCLEEALKFYRADNDLPGVEAFFCETSRRRFREHPEQFSRERLHQMRNKLPSLRVMQSSLAGNEDAKPTAETDNSSSPSSDPTYDAPQRPAPSWWQRLRDKFRPHNNT